MTRVALYRKYRPQNFNEVLGQASAMKILENAVKSSSFSHAYIFCGPRGIGKTSVARIMAKAVNCKNPKDGNPCNRCEACKSINEQTALDIIEIDAASNRGIDEIRDLREKVKFSPSELKYKVFIIDEVHMLTKEAFNALLKTLEEPPEHALFIMATTEIHKIPATVISRCQRFDFQRISDTELIKGLTNIAKKEEIEIDDEATSVIVRASEGGFRDAISILDQISTHTGSKKKIGKDDIAGLLGLVGSDKIEKLFNMIETSEKKNALDFLSELLEQGADIGQLTKGLLVSYQKSMKKELDDKEKLSKYIAAVEILSKSNIAFKYALYPQLSLEVAVLKIMNILDGDILEAAKENINSNGSQQISEKISNMPKDKRSFEKKDNPEFQWHEILLEIKSKNNSIHAFVKESEPVIVGEEIHLIFPYKFHKERIEDRKNKKVVEEAINKVSGIKYKIICKVGEVKNRPESKKEPVKENFELDKEKNNDINLNEVLDVLGGELV